MLKRQRASSPSPLIQATATDLPLFPPDPSSSEHGAKRRRILEPSLDVPSREWGALPVPLGDVVDEDDMMHDDAPKIWASMGDPSLGGTNEYKAANSLLHDLHAEQQHRRLMTLSSYSNSSSPGPSSSHGWSSSTFRQPPTGKTDFVPHSPPNFIQDAPPTEKYRQDINTTETKNRLCSADDVSVYDWYEETNRFLGLVFLGRRRDLSPPVDL